MLTRHLRLGGVTRAELMKAPPGALVHLRMPTFESLRKYNLTPALFEEFARRQNFSCGICKKVRRLVIDHNHKTGKVRGLLCFRCNTGLALFDLGLNEAALEYLNLPPL